MVLVFCVVDGVKDIHKCTRGKYFLHLPR